MPHLFLEALVQFVGGIFECRRLGVEFGQINLPFGFGFQ